MLYYTLKDIQAGVEWASPPQRKARKQDLERLR